MLLVSSSNTYYDKEPRRSWDWLHVTKVGEKRQSDRVRPGAPVFLQVGHTGNFKFATGGEAGVFLPLSLIEFLKSKAR